MSTTIHRTYLRAVQYSDAEIIRASLVDAGVFELLFSRHAKAIFAFVAARVGPPHAEDVTSETFANAFRSRRGFDLAAASALPWLYGIAANTLKRHYTLEARWLERPSLELRDAASDDLALLDERIDAMRLAPQLARALAELNAGERDVLLMHVLGDMTHEEIAQALGIRRGSAKSRLSRGRAKLRAALPHLAQELENDR